MFHLKTTPWREADAGKEYLKNLKEKTELFAKSLEIKTLSTVLTTPEPLLTTKIDVEALNQPKFERPSGSGCFVETRVEIIREPINWEMYKPAIYYNDNKGKNYSSPMPGQILES